MTIDVHEAAASSKPQAVQTPEQNAAVTTDNKREQGSPSS